MKQGDIEFDQSALVAQLFKAMRTSESRERRAEKLGVDKSTLYKWETGRSKPHWNHLIAYLKLKGFFDPEKPKSLLDDYFFNSASLLESLLKKTTLDEAVEISGLNKGSLYKILQGKHEIKVETVFRLWSRLQMYSFLIFINESVGLESLEETSGFAQRWELEHQLSMEYPFFAGVIYAIQRGVPVEGAALQLSRYFSVAKESIEELLDKLVEAQMISATANFYSLIHPHFFHSAYDFKLNQQLQIFWSNNSLNLLAKQGSRPKRSAFNYKIMSLSEEAYQDFKKEYDRFFNKCFQIAQSDQGKKKTLHSLSLQFVDLDELSEDKS